MYSSSTRKQRLLVAIERHKRTDRKTGAISCTVHNCEFKTAQADAFKLHVLRYHADDDLKPHACVHCPERFVLKSFLEDHVKWTHQYEPAPRAVGKRRKLEYEATDELFVQFADSPWWELLLARATRKDAVVSLSSEALSPLETILKEMEHALKQLEILVQELLRPSSNEDSSNVIEIPSTIASAFDWEVTSWTPKDKEGRSADLDLLLRHRVDETSKKMESFIDSVISGSDANKGDPLAIELTKGNGNWGVSITPVAETVEPQDDTVAPDNAADDNEDNEETETRLQAIDKSMQPFMKPLPSGEFDCVVPSCKISPSGITGFRAH